MIKMVKKRSQGTTETKEGKKEGRKETNKEERKEGRDDVGN